MKVKSSLKSGPRSFQTISNIMKNRTDTAKNSIRNMN